MSATATVRQRRVFRSRMGKRRIPEPEAKEQKKRFLRFMARLFELTAAGVMLTAGYHLCLTHPYFEVKQIKVEGEKTLMEGDIYGMVNPYLRGNVFLVDVEAAREKLMANPWIKNADVYRILPNGIGVRVLERDPVAVLHAPGQSYLMDEEGVLLEKAYGDNDLVQITGIPGTFVVGEKIDLHSLESAVTIYNLFKRDTLFNDPVVSMEFLATRQIAAVTGDGVRLKFGLQPEVWEEKFLEYLTVRKILQDKGETYASLDLSFRDKVVVSLNAEDKNSEQKPVGTIH